MSLLVVCSWLHEHELIVFEVRMSDVRFCFCSCEEFSMIVFSGRKMTPKISLQMGFHDSEPLQTSFK